MRSKKTGAVLIIASAAVVSIAADTVTDFNNVRLNGKVISMDSEWLILEGQFPEGANRLRLGRRDIKRIEFNENNVNTGGADKAFAVKPPTIKESAKPTPMQQTGPAALDSIYLFDGGEVKCRTLMLDLNAIQCEGKTKAVQRSQVRAIVFARP